MALFWNDSELQELWTLSVEELALLPDGTDKGRLSFAVQLKFMELHGRFPERHDEIHPAAVAWVATQLSIAADAFAAFELDGRQGRRYRRVIRAFLGFRPATAGDLKRLSLWLSKDVLPFDPQARHGRDLALDWCRAERVDPPALNHLDRVTRSAVHRYETGLQEILFSRLTAQTRANIDRLLAGSDPEQDLPADFAAKRDSYYTLLQAPKDPQAFIDQMQAAMRQGLETLNDALSDNPKVRLRQQGKNRIHLSPLDRQAEPANTEALKCEIGGRCHR